MSSQQYRIIQEVLDGRMVFRVQSRVKGRIFWSRWQDCYHYVAGYPSRHVYSEGEAEELIEKLWSASRNKSV